MWLDKNGDFDKPSIAIGTGILWRPVGGGIAVLGIVDGAPGAGAGIVVGDKPVSVDGRPAAAEMSAMFRDVGRGAQGRRRPRRLDLDHAGSATSCHAVS